MPINSIDLVTLPSRSAEASTIAGRFSIWQTAVRRYWKKKS